MEFVSNKWKANQRKTFVNESYIKIFLDVNDPEATADAKLISNGKLPFSDEEQELLTSSDETIINYGFVEQNGWLLDGSKSTLPVNKSDIKYVGFISENLSNVNCTFDKNILITVNFTRMFQTSIPAITIKWGNSENEYPTKFELTAYYLNEVVKKILVNANTELKTSTQVDFSNYDKITIEVLEWCLPYHRVKIESIFLGLRQEYDKKDLISFSYENETDVIGTVQPTNKLKFEVDNTSSTYDPDNDKGLAKYILEQQRITAKVGFKVDDNTVEWIPLGIYYLSSWSAPQKGLTASFEADNIMSFLQGTFYKSLYRPNGINLYQLAVEVLESCNLQTNDDGSKKYVIDESLADITTTAPLPLVSHLACLQYIAQAGCCSLYVDRKGNIHLEKLTDEMVDYDISNFNMYSYPEVELQKPLRNVIVNVYTYSLNKDNEPDYQEDSLFNNNQGSIFVKDNNLSVAKFDTPGCPSIVSISELENVEGTAYTYAYIIDSYSENESTKEGVNVSIQATGKKLITYEPTSIKIEGNLSGEDQLVDNPLITNVANAQKVGEWVKKWLMNRKQVTSEFRCDPSLDCLDKIKLENKYNVIQPARVTSVSVTYSNSFKGTVKGRVV